jgi:hypothetical protein
MTMIRVRDWRRDISCACYTFVFVCIHLVDLGSHKWPHIKRTYLDKSLLYARICSNFYSYFLRWFQSRLKIVLWHDITLTIGSRISAWLPPYIRRYATIENELCYLSRRKINVTRTDKSTTQSFNNAIQRSTPISTYIAYGAPPI